MSGPMAFETNLTNDPPRHVGQDNAEALASRHDGACLDSGLKSAADLTHRPTQRTSDEEAK